MRKPYFAVAVACAVLVVCMNFHRAAAQSSHDITVAAATSTLVGGEAQIGFNPDALKAYGLRIDQSTARTRTPGTAGVRYDLSTFSAHPGSALEIQRRGSTFAGLGAGALRFDGGFMLGYDGGVVDLRGFALQAAAAPFGVDLADANGTVWLTADHAHFGFDERTPGEFSMRHMNLRLSPHFAQVLGRADLEGAPIGGLAFHARIDAGVASGANGSAVCAAPFPGAGLVTDVQLIYSSLSGHSDSIYAARCGLPPLPSGGTCTTTSTNGKLVIGMDASLRNAGETAVAWHEKFSGVFPPYNNDQHPYLIWNLYRIDSAGRIKQIGASGVKHAFFATNQGCGCSPGHVFMPTCQDVYSLEDNDNGMGMQNLAPRSEIIPATAQWGRCGSVWDANCDGSMDAGSGAQDLYQYRLLASESDLLPPLSVGARYFLEYWYIVRDDSDIDDTMAYREVQPQKTDASWSVPLVQADLQDTDFFQGPAINRWVDPVAPPPNAMNRELATPLGHARVAAKVTSLGGGQWRYEYAVMNLDYAHAQIDPAHPSEPNMKLLSNQGFARFSVRLPLGASAANLRFDDADGDAGNDWSANAGPGAVTWTALPGGTTLDWGMLYHFEFTTSFAPVMGTSTLVGAATSSEPAPTYTLALPGPSDSIFSDGFDHGATE